MTTTTIQQSPFLPLQRNFPFDNAQALGTVLDQSYLEVASKVNSRTIGLYAKEIEVITGESYFIQGQPARQQALRKVFTFTSQTTIPHGLNFATIDYFTKMYGQYTDGTNWFGIIPATSNPVVNQVSFYLDSTNINIIINGTAPVPTKGIIDLEWIPIL